MALNLVNAESISTSYGTRILLDDVSLGLAAADVVGVVGRNGDGKSTLLKILTGEVEPDSGRVTRTSGTSVGVLHQTEDLADERSVRHLLIGDADDYVWASDARSRLVVEHLLSDISLDATLSDLSGGERRRVELVSLLIGHHDMLVLDEPTNHLDVEAVAWLARHLNELSGVAMLIVSHDRWFLDAVCNHIWEVHDAQVEPYDGGYAAYVLARAERQRIAAAREARRRNLVRKELAWLRRGAPARTSKPKFRIEAANELIADVPEPRDSLALQQFSSARLGKDVIDLKDVTVDLPDGRRLFDHVTWSIGPGDRIGLIGVNGSGKSTLMRVMAKTQPVSGGKVKHGLTLRLAHLTQHVDEMDADDQVLRSVTRLREEIRLATGREASAANLVEEFGFSGDKLVTRIGDLSGGERRRLQLLRLLIGEPNVLMLDEPTNDLDIDTLVVLEDYLDTWPGTLIVASHDRYFLERVTDVQYAITDNGRCVLLPGGIEQYLSDRSERAAEPQQPEEESRDHPSDAAALRRLKKSLARTESQLGRISDQITHLQARMADAASDYEQLMALQPQLEEAQARHAELENTWLELGEELEALS